MTRADRAPAAGRDDRRAGAMFDPRSRAWRHVLAALLLVAASFASLHLHLAGLFEARSLARIGRFASEFVPPDTSAPLLARLAPAALETLAMSAMGTLLAAAAGIVLALPAARRAQRRAGLRYRAARWLLNALRAIPELVWAALLAVALGLGPMAGTLALALHTSGVLGRLFAEAIENAAPGPAQALRASGCGEGQVFAYATLPLVGAQLVAYTLYRWENNIRAAAVLGVVGAGGLGQMLLVYLGLFQMRRAATVVGAMLLLVLAVDYASVRIRRALDA